MKSLLVAAAVATAALTVVSVPEAEARRGGFHVGFRHVAVYRPVYRPIVRFGYVAPVYSGYCRWYRTPYGAVRRCF